MKIAILGYGNVGQNLAGLFAAAGNDVIIGMRNDVSDCKYPVFGFSEAVSQADAVALAIPYHVCGPVLQELASELNNKIIIDNTNPLNDDWSPLLLGQENSAAEEISRIVPGAKVVKAFNTIFADVMQKPVRDGQKITAFIAGDDQDAKANIMTLAENMGYEPLDTGGLCNARYLEAMAHLNIQIAVGQGGGTDAAFIYSR